MDPDKLPPGLVFRLDEAAGFVLLRDVAGPLAVVFCEEADDRVADHVRRLAGVFPVLVVYRRALPGRLEALLAAGAKACVPLGASVAELMGRFGVEGADPQETAAADGRVLLADCGLVVGGQEFRLSPAEYRIVQVLWAAEGQTVTHAELEWAVYGRTGVSERAAVRQAIYRLRTRLGPLGRVVDTVPGFGYRLLRELPPESQLLSNRYGPVIAS